MTTLLAMLPPWAITALFLLTILWAIAWIILPFAIIGTKPILRRILEAQRETNRLLESANHRAGVDS
jgi:hypothetical protein